MSWILDRFKRVSNIFKQRNEYEAVANTQIVGHASSYQPDRVRFRSSNERSIIAPIYTRIAMDVAAISIRHVRLDELGRYTEPIDSTLNRCLSLEPNIDQTAVMFFQSLVMSMFDEGVVAVVPVDCSANPQYTTSYDIYTLRIGRITEWWPEFVRVRIYNDQTGDHEELVFPKKCTAIIENPFYSIMNERGSVLQRLIHKLNQLDAIDEQSASGKLDLIIQFPYLANSERKQDLAAKRLEAIENQLNNSKHGVVYMDATDKVTQLNRPVENNLMTQIEYLTTTLYGQLGLTKEVFEGNAEEQEMLNYNNRALVPILEEICLEFKRKFLSRTAQSQGQSIEFFRDPFKLVPAEKLAEIADKLSRNEILSSNEIRSTIGYRPVEDPRADELRNKNIGADKDQLNPRVAQPKAEDTGF